MAESICVINNKAFKFYILFQKAYNYSINNSYHFNDSCFVS
jgi:hypothetical protein